MNPYDHPNWQKKRLEVMQRDKFSCTHCGDNQTKLNVHHKRYLNNQPVWESPTEDLTTLCRPCHEVVHHIRTNPNPMQALSELLAYDWHGHMMLADGLWRCVCGCGLTQTPEDFKATNPTEI